MDEHGCSGSHAVAGYTSCLSSIPKREFTWSRNTSRKYWLSCTKTKTVLSAWFFSLWLFFKRSNIFREKQQYIYRKELLSRGLFCVLESILFASYYSYLMTFHYLPGHSETLLPRFEVVFTAGIFLYGFMAKAFCSCTVVWVLHLYLWTKAQWYNISVTFFFFFCNRNAHW